MKKLQVTYEKPQNLIPYVNNHKIHSDEQILRLASAIQEFGFSQPIVVDKNNIIIAGHGRREAAIKLNLKQVPIVVADHLDEYQVKAMRIADNKASSTEYNNDLLKFDIKTLELKEFNMASLAIRNDELDDLLKDVDVGLDKFEFLKVEAEEQVKKIEKENKVYDEKAFVEDVIPEVKEPRAKLGDIFKLGNHRLMCGDSTNKDSILKLTNGDNIEMVYTDPPYGISHSGKGLNGATKGNNFGEILGDGDVSVAINSFRLCLDLFKDKFLIFWGANYFPTALIDGYGWIVWDKQREGETFSGAELAFVNKGVKVNIFRHQWHGMIKASEHGQARVHPTQKPVALAEWCFDKYGNPKSVLDLFGGSGSTLIACDKKNIKCYMMEFDPKYVDIIIARWEKYTGLKAELLS